MPEWKPIDTTAIATDQTLSPSHIRLLTRNTEAYRTEPLQYVHTYWDRYRDDIPDTYQGLQIHTPVYDFRSLNYRLMLSQNYGGSLTQISPNFSRFQYDYEITPYIYYKTVPRFWAAATEYGGKVEVSVRLSPTPLPSRTDDDDLTGSETPYTVLESTSNAYEIAELPSAIVSRSRPPAYGLDIALNVRSQLGAEVESLAEKISVGNFAQGFASGRRSVLELPLSFPDLDVTKTPLTGCHLGFRDRPISEVPDSVRVAMDPYPTYWFVEHENLLDDGKDSDPYKVFTWPPFPEQVFSVMVGKNFSEIVNESENFENVYEVRETTGIIIKAITFSVRRAQ